jgi:hypothetical protein
VVPQLGGLAWGYNPFIIKKINLFAKNAIEPRTWMDSLDKRPKRRNMNMRYGLWNVRRLYRAGSLMTVSRELARYKLDLVAVQEVRWEDGGTEPAGEYIFFYGKGNRIMN